jgi:mRNA-degrading endonuclease RelE of RelBE toxin-antitoxin system
MSEPIPQISVKIEFTPNFDRDVKMLSKRYRNVKKDLRPNILSKIENGNFVGKPILDFLLENTFPYRVYKVRCKNSDALRGKRGGYRLIYCTCTNHEEGYILAIILTVYSKSDQEDIADTEIVKFIKDYMATNNS